MQTFDLSATIQNLLSPNNSIRTSAQNQINSFYEKMSIQDLNSLFDILPQIQDQNNKMYICILIKNYIEQKITQNNKNDFIQFLTKKINFISSILLEKENNLKIINMILLSLCKGLSYFDQNDFFFNIITDIFSYFLKFYEMKKNSQDIKSTIQCLHISYKFLKFIQKLNVNKNIDNLISNFYNVIIQDFENICKNILTNNYITNVIILESLTYYLRVFKHSFYFITDNKTDIIITNTYNLNVSILNNLLTTNNNNNNSETINKLIFDIIFLSNKIIILYISFSNNLSIDSIKKYADMFFIFVEKENVFIYIQNILRNSKEISEFRENKFLLNILEIFYELIELGAMTEFTDLVIFGKGYSDNAIKISDYFLNEYWTPDKIKKLILFILKNYLIFKPREIIMGQTDPEEFYLWFCNSTTGECHVRAKAGQLCRKIYDTYKDELKDIFNSLENDLFNLTAKEYNLLMDNNFNNKEYLADFQINIKCAILSFYYYIDNFFMKKDIDSHKWVNQILLSQLNTDFIYKKLNNEIFSIFIVINMLSNVVSLHANEKTKKNIFNKVSEVFLCEKFDNLLLNLACIDFLSEYCEEESDVINYFPKNFLNLYFIKIGKMLNDILSPDIHSQIVDATKNILEKIQNEELTNNFYLIFQTLKFIWDNNSKELISTNNTSNENKKYFIRGNLLKIISSFVIKNGLFISFDNINFQNNLNVNYFDFIYEIIGYSLDINSSKCDYVCKDAFNLIILIQDDFMENSPLSMQSNIFQLKTPITSYYSYKFFKKMYNYLNVILPNLSNSLQYFMLQFAIIEQFISLSFEQEISSILDNMNFVEKIIYILNYFLNNHMNEYYLYLFNIIEYVYYIVVQQSKMSHDNKNKYNDFIYKLIQDKLNKNIEINLKYNNLDDIDDNTKNMIGIYIGLIQLANRFIYVNKLKGFISNDFNILVAQKIFYLYEFRNIFNELQLKIMKNCMFNLKNLINENINRELKIKLDEFYNNLNKSHYLNLKDKIAGHWLYFFNKIFSGVYYFKLNTDEEKIKYIWKKKLEDIQQGDSIKKEYKLKFLLLQNDDMYINEE